MLVTLPELIAKARAHLRCLDAETALKEIQATGGTMIDVREPVELETSPAPYSVNIPRGILEMKVMDVLTDAAPTQSQWPVFDAEPGPPRPTQPSQPEG